ncbi:uncharacterized protein LOC144872478 isoform X3 [Branchiostoma floridae x Branchiostoma japonicum]
MPCAGWKGSKPSLPSWVPPWKGCQAKMVRDKPHTASAVPDEKVAIFVAQLEKLIDGARQAETLLRPVCEFVFDSIELALMKNLTRNPGRLVAMKQAWPVEWAKIDSVLTSVKQKMETVDDKFKDATKIVIRAVTAVKQEERLKAMKEFEAIQSDIQSVFNVCLEAIIPTQATLKNLEPEIAKAIHELRDRAMTVLVTVALAAFMAAKWFPTWRVYVVAIALLIIVGSFALSMNHRSELRNDLAYYNAEISLIMKIDLTKNQLEGQQNVLEKLINDM